MRFKRNEHLTAGRECAATRCSNGGDVVAGQREVNRPRSIGDRSMGRSELIGLRIVQHDSVKSKRQPMLSIKSLHGQMPATRDANILKTNITVLRITIRVGARIVVVRVQHNRLLRVTNTDVPVLHVGYEAAPRWIALDAKAVIRAIEREVLHQDVVNATKRLTANRHT